LLWLERWELRPRELLLYARLSPDKAVKRSVIEQDFLPWRAVSDATGKAGGQPGVVCRMKRGISEDFYLFRKEKQEEGGFFARGWDLGDEIGGAEGGNGTKVRGGARVGVGFW
jgi:hypothetical protein